MSWLACRSMRGPVRRLVHQTESYTHSTYRMAVRVHADDDGLGSDDGCRDMAEGRASGCMDDRMPMFCTPSFREAIDIAGAVRSHRLRRIRFTIVRCVSMLLIVGAVAVASLPFAMQARSARRLAETSDSAARAVAGWPYPMAENELERAHEYNRRLAVEGQPVLGEAADPFSAATDGGVGGSVVSVADVDTEYQGLLDSGAGIMGTVLVPGIGVELPIRHGTSEPVLAVVVGCVAGGMTLCCLIVRSIRPRRIVMRHAFARPAGM